MDTDLLTERLHHLADAAPVPATAPADDVRRGRRRLLRRRAAGVVGTAAAVAVASSVGLLGGLAPASDDAPAPDPTTQGPVAQAPGGRPLDAAKALEMVRGRDGVRFTLAEVLALTTVVEDRVDGPVRWIGLGRARSWQAAGAPDCPPGWTCDDVEVERADRARWASARDVGQLVAQLPGGVLVLTVNKVDERPRDVAYRTD